MPESQLLIGLDTSFKNRQKALNVNIYSISVYIKSIHQLLLPPPLPYGLYAWKNVDNYELSLILMELGRNN